MTREISDSELRDALGCRNCDDCPCIAHQLERAMIASETMNNATLQRFSTEVKTIANDASEPSIVYFDDEEAQ